MHISHTESRDSAQQFLTFMVDGAEYGVDLLSVQEIRAFSPITPLPGSPRHVNGVMNLRGVLVPVIGLRERFGLSTVPYDRYTVIVVLHVEGRIVGAIVDAVCDVLTLGAADIDPCPDLGLTDRRFLRGLGKVKERLVTLIEPSSLLSDVVATVEAA